MRRPWDGSRGGADVQRTLVGSALARDAVIGTTLAQNVLGLVDAVWVQDDRIAKLAGARQGVEPGVEQRGPDCR